MGLLLNTNSDIRRSEPVISGNHADSQVFRGRSPRGLVNADVAGKLSAPTCKIHVDRRLAHVGL